MAKVAKVIEGVQLQLTFKAKQYQAISDAASDDNRRMELVSRKDKIHMYKAIEILVDQGLAFRQHKVYVPEDKKKLYMKDEKFSRLLAKAEIAMEEFKIYQDKLLSV